MINTLQKPNTAIPLQKCLDEILDMDFGILQEIKEVPRYASDPVFFHYIGRACDTFPFSGQKNFFNSGGASTIRENALYKAVGEAIERYSSAIYDPATLPLHSFESAQIGRAHV